MRTLHCYAASFSVTKRQSVALQTSGRKLCQQSGFGSRTKILIKWYLLDWPEEVAGNCLFCFTAESGIWVTAGSGNHEQKVGMGKEFGLNIEKWDLDKKNEQGNRIYAPVLISPQGPSCFHELSD